MTTTVPLELHLASEKKTSPICESCGKEFSNVHTLKSHRNQVHQGIKNFQCSICSAKFTTRYKTMRHFQAVHSDIRNYNCDYQDCDSTFKTSDMLRKHQRIHFPGPYECEKCLQVFKFKSGLDYHTQLKHKHVDLENAKIYVCPECGREFRKSIAYENHRKLQHPLSNQSFSPKELNPKSRRPNIKIVKSAESELECQYCHKRYKSKANFVVHLASHENAEEMQDYDYIISKDEEVLDDTDEAEQHLDEDIEAAIVQDSSENLLKGVDEDLVSIVKFETERFVDVPGTQISSAEVDSQSMIDDTVEALEGEGYLPYDDADYLVESVHHEDVIEDAMAELEPEYLDFYASENIEQTDDLMGTSLTRLEITQAAANNTGVCDECGKSFKHSHHLKRHFMRKHQIDSKKLECDICGAKFLLSYDLKRHMIKHSTKRSFKCNLCENAFKTANYLKNHVQSVHAAKPERNFQCKICDRTYRHERHLNYHLRKHQNDLRFSCDLCNPPQLFHYSDAVKWHKIRYHDHPAPFNCSTCNRRFIHEKSLKTHEKAHQENGSLAVTCPICGKSVSEKRHLKRHIRTHADHKFNCPCGISFKERHQLTKQVPNFGLLKQILKFFF